MTSFQHGKMQSYNNFEKPLMSLKRTASVSYGTRCVGLLCHGPRITGSVSPPEQERFLTDNEIIEHDMVRPYGETVNAVG